MENTEIKINKSLIRDILINDSKKRNYKKILKRVAIAGGIAVVGYIAYRYLKNKDTSSDGHILKAMSPNDTIWDFETQTLRTVKDYFNIKDEADELLDSMYCSDIDDWSDFSR